MRGTVLPAAPSRIKGRQSLVRRLRALLLASYRYGRHRAASRDEQQFAAQLIDGLTATLEPSTVPCRLIDISEHRGAL